MTLRFAPAIVLAVLLLFLFVTAFRALQRYLQLRRRKPRRRDAAPLRFQRKYALLAGLKRLRRGLRFPTVQQKRQHARFKKALLKDLRRQQEQNRRAMLQRQAVNT